MSVISSPIRQLMRASSVAVLCLLSASAAQAASAPGWRGAPTWCDEHSATLQKLRRHARSYGGPLARQPQRALFGLSDVNARVQRGLGANADDNAAAIQNDAPAANISDEGRETPTLRPLGLLIGPLAWRPPIRAFFPKSPRGPPVPA